MKKKTKSIGCKTLGVPLSLWFRVLLSLVRGLGSRTLYIDFFSLFLRTGTNTIRHMYSFLL